MPRPPAAPPLATDAAIARKLADYARSVDAGLVVLATDGRVEWANDAFLSHARASADELKGQPLVAFPDDAAAESALGAHVRDALARGETGRIELSLRGRDGQRRRIDVEVHAVRGEDGEPTGYVARTLDVSDSRRADAAVAESEERYRTLVELSPEPIAVHAGGRVAFVNAAALQLLGARNESEVLGRPIFEFVHPDFHRIVSERVLKMEASGEPVTLLAEKLVRLDGTGIDVELAAAPILWDGEPAIQLVGRDVTAQRRAAEERRTLEARLQQALRHESLVSLAAGVAEDFGGVVRSILEQTDLLLLELGDDALAAGPVREIRSSTLRAATLVRRMLAFAGPPPSALGPLDVSRLVIELSQTLDGTVSRRASLGFDLAGNLPAVSGDPVQLGEVVTTLIRNASDALGGEAGRIQVRTSARTLDASELAPFVGGDLVAPGRFVLLEVSDSGCGMDAATQARIFDPFFSTHVAGRGLGLSASLGIVRAHGGAVRVESELGRGTRIGVALPALAGAGESDAPAGGAEGTGERRGGRRRRAAGDRPHVLVVDDEPGMRSMARRVLERAGFEVHLASDGREAVEAFREMPARFAAVLLDLTMPRLDGEAALREMVAIRRDVRVVLSSGHASAEVVERLGDLPVAGFLKKPYDAASLRTLLRSVVSGEA
jgi:PAS domain S-box-containing protein